MEEDGGAGFEEAQKEKFGVLSLVGVKGKKEWF